jgi:hypothetical protein
MTAMTFDTAPRVARLMSTFRAFLRMLGEAVDAYVEYRMTKVVSELQLRHADREVQRYRRMMQGGK